MLSGFFFEKLNIFVFNARMLRFLEKKDSSKVLFLKYEVLHPEYRILGTAHRILAASRDYVCCDGDLVMESFQERKDVTDAIIKGQSGFTEMVTYNRGKN